MARGRTAEPIEGRGLKICVSKLEHLRKAALEQTYVSLGGRRTDSVHEFYRYPARFTPWFARAAIEAFSSPGDLVIDPFCGGGTTAVEAQLTGRTAIAADINQLATFVTLAKTTLYGNNDLELAREFANEAEDLRLRSVCRGDAELEPYWYNISGTAEWRIRDLINSAISLADEIDNNTAVQLVRCALLRTGQWALDMRRNVPSVADFRLQLSNNVRAMAWAAMHHRHSVEAVISDAKAVTVVQEGLPGAAEHDALHKSEAPRLILTSPPYASTYVNYHRWKVRSRRETAAPFWIAGRLDGHGISHYTLGASGTDSDERYFREVKRVFAALVSLMSDETWLVQVVGFKKGEAQLDQYLNTMRSIGLEEVLFPSLSTELDGRLWRRIPSRRWWVSAEAMKAQGNGTINEVVLIHRRIAGGP